jgi:hypothetical protein
MARRKLVVAWSQTLNKFTKVLVVLFVRNCTHILLHGVEPLEVPNRSLVVELGGPFKQDF